MRKSDYKDVQEALFQWFKVGRNENIPLTGPTLAAKADKLAHKLGYADFTACQSWVERFKQRRSIVCRTLCGESKAVDENLVEDYQTSKLPGLLAGYELPGLLAGYELPGLLAGYEPRPVSRVRNFQAPRPVSRVRATRCLQHR